MSLMGVNGDAAVGNILVAVSRSGEGHPPEFWAERLTAQIIRVSDTAPQPIRDQAQTYKEAIYLTCLQIIRQAQASAVAHASRKTGA